MDTSKSTFSLANSWTVGDISDQCQCVHSTLTFRFGNLLATLVFLVYKQQMMNEVIPRSIK